MALIVGLAVAYMILSFVLTSLFHLSVFLLVISFFALFVVALALEVERVWPWRILTRWAAGAQIAAASVLWLAGFNIATPSYVPDITSYGLERPTANMLALSGLVGLIAAFVALYRIEQNPPPKPKEDRLQRLGLSGRKAKELAPSDTDRACVISVERARVDGTEFSIAVLRIAATGSMQSTCVVEFRFDADNSRPLGSMAEDFASVLAFIGNLPVWMCSPEDLRWFRLFAGCFSLRVDNPVRVCDSLTEELFGRPVPLEKAAAVLGLDAGDTTGPIARAKLATVLIDHIHFNEKNEGVRAKARAAFHYEERLAANPDLVRAKQAQAENAASVRSWIEKQNGKAKG
jgi:hypothetical protein